VLALLDACATQVRGLAEVVAHPRAGHDERLLAACHRVEDAVRRLVARDERPYARPDERPDARRTRGRRRV